MITQFESFNVNTKFTNNEIKSLQKINFTIDKNTSKRNNNGIIITIKKKYDKKELIYELSVSYNKKTIKDYSDNLNDIIINMDNYIDIIKDYKNNIKKYNKLSFIKRMVTHEPTIYDDNLGFD